MTKWTINDIIRTGLGNNLNSSENKKSDLDNKIPKKPKLSIEKQTIEKVLWVFHREGKIPKYVQELQFHDLRKFRFDWAIPEWKLAIEYEGIFSKKSRHTGINGYTIDCEKYNLAQLEGWKILRYTAKNYNQFSNDLKIFTQKVNQ